MILELLQQGGEGLFFLMRFRSCLKLLLSDAIGMTTRLLLGYIRQETIYIAM